MDCLFHLRTIVQLTCVLSGRCSYGYVYALLLSVVVSVELLILCISYQSRRMVASNGSDKIGSTCRSIRYAG